MTSKDQVHTLLTSALSPTHLEVDDISGNCGTSFNVVVVSASFEGKGALQRHRLVHSALGEDMKKIHALTIKAHTPSEFTAGGGPPKSA
eukprot:c20796_g1_i1.p1 GENE.c20796_g1_i1~~c20796_g1_i1.p1  ORF type:complete len:101 (-),score=18.51 c20796_g1_i1:239-505(-)